MIDLYSWPTPNGVKMHILVEELGIPYTLHPVNIGKGEQFDAEFLKISPNNKIPAMIDRDGPEGNPYTVFESGAMMLYLAEKTGRLVPSDPAGKYDVIQWLMFQMGGVGPMFGQHSHFTVYAPEQVPYAMVRYAKECDRLVGVIENRLSRSEYLAGDDYTIADIATYAWTRLHERLAVDVSDKDNFLRWIGQIEKRPAVLRGTALLTDLRPEAKPDAETLKNYFGDPQHNRA